MSKYKNYLHKGDLISSIDSTNLDELTGSSDTIWQDIEKKELEYVAGFVRHWYDADVEFRSINLHSSSTIYAVDARVYTVSSGVYKEYKCIKATINGIQATNTEYWTETDDRNPTLVRILVDLVIYRLSGRNRSGNTPEIRLINHDKAVADLKMIQSGKINLDIEINTFDTDEDEREDEGQVLSWGTSQTGSNNEY